MNAYRLKLAENAAEREQVHRLNYATFVEEIPQHPPNDERRLVDRFDAQNEYAIALTGAGEVIGMLALRAQRPFSLDQKLECLDDHLPPHRSLCELRLLAVRREHRHRVLLRDLVAFTTQRCVHAGHDLAVISGTTRQIALYRHLGFEPFGPLVGAPGAQFQPMYLSLEALRASAGTVLGVSGAQAPRASARFTPGPVTVSAAVRAAMAEEAAPHRSAEFVTRVARVRRALCELTGAGDAALMVGTGTLANDAVAAALRARPGRGLVLANGEFGERLIEQARCAGLEFDELRLPWGEPFAEALVAEAAARSGGASWIWAVHCETSTGVLNDVDALKRSAQGARAALCLDCLSSIGAVPLRLDGVWLASASSAKGLAAYPGLAAVLVNGAAPRTVPPTARYLDLAYWLRRDSVPFTHSSNLVAALDAALAQVDWDARLGHTARDARWLRSALRAREFVLVAPEAAASPAVVSIALPKGVPADEVGAALARRGFEIAWRSAYLASRNWVQVALMGAYDRVALRQLPDALAEEARARALSGVRAA